MADQIKLADIASVRLCYPFRGKVPEHINGNGKVIQLRNINKEGDIDWSNLMPTDVLTKHQQTFLQTGDIIFAARGGNNVACLIDRTESNIVSSQHFYMISVNNVDEILPEFLAWQINQAIAQKYFTQSAVGFLHVSIRRAVLDTLPITIPSMNKQKTIVALAQKAKREKQLLNQLIENRDTEMQFIAKQILQ